MAVQASDIVLVLLPVAGADRGRLRRPPAAIEVGRGVKKPGFSALVVAGGRSALASPRPPSVRTSRCRRSARHPSRSPSGPLYALGAGRLVREPRHPELGRPASRSTSASSSATASRPGPPWPPGRSDGFSGFVVQGDVAPVRPAAVHPRLARHPARRCDERRGARGSCGWFWRRVLGRRSARVSCPSCAGSSPPGRGASVGEAPKRCVGARSPTRLGLLFGGNLATEILFVVVAGHSSFEPSGSPSGSTSSC